MEKDILSPQRRVDILLWMGWGRVFLEHLMAIMGWEYVCVCMCCEGGKNGWVGGGVRYVQDSTAGSCHSLTLSPMYPPTK